MAVLSVVLPATLAEGAMAAVSGGLGIVLLIGALICFVPFISDTFIKLTEKFFGLVFGNIGLLAVKNMRGNKSIYDNIILLTIGLASMMTISIMGSGIQKDTMAEFEIQTYDIHVYAAGVRQPHRGFCHWTVLRTACFTKSLGLPLNTMMKRHHSLKM